MGGPNLPRGIGVIFSLSAALLLRGLSRTYGNLASHLDERRAEDELDANMGQRHAVEDPTSRAAAIPATPTAAAEAAQPEGQLRHASAKQSGASAAAMRRRWIIEHSPGLSTGLLFHD